MSHPNSHNYTKIGQIPCNQGSSSAVAPVPVPILPNPESAACPLGTGRRSLADELSVLGAAAVKLPSALNLMNTVTTATANASGRPEAVAAAATWQLMQQALVGGNLNGLQAAGLLNNNTTHTAQSQFGKQDHPLFGGDAQQKSLQNSMIQQQSQSLQPAPSKMAVQSVTPASTLRLSPHFGTSHSSLAASSVSSDPPIPMVVSNGKAAHRAADKKRRAEFDSESSNAYDTSRAGKSQKMDAYLESSSNFSFDTLVPPKPKTEEEMARMTPAERRRYERNLREQQRSYRISQQIKELRDVLAESNIPFKSNKFSILVSVTEYIKQLQSRAIMLDAEHQKLVTTISQSSSLVPPPGPSSSSEDSEKDAASLQSVADNDQDLLMVQGIDYKSIFGGCPFAIGVASLDGRVLACNEALGTLLGCSQQDMVEQSLFLYIRNHQEIFEAMADLLKRSSVASETGQLPDNHGQLLYWCGKIFSQKSQKLHFTITLTVTSDSNPKYFSFSASPMSVAA